MRSLYLLISKQLFGCVGSVSYKQSKPAVTNDITDGFPSL